MMPKQVALLIIVAVALVSGCAQTGESNAFITLTEDVLGVQVSPGTDGGGGSGGDASADRFRRTMQLALANNSAAANLRVTWLAWVEVSSLRSAEQQDLLLANGYQRLAREAQIGVIRLAPGTFVRNGPGFAGSERLTIPRGVAVEGAAGDEEGGGQAGVQATTRVFTLITPDAFLFFSQPPSSCDSAAFYFIDDEEVQSSPILDSTGSFGLFDSATGGGGIKTLAQIDAYVCDPFRPGLYLRAGGGAKARNEYFEGENIRVDFFPNANVNGIAAAVRIGQ